MRWQADLGWDGLPLALAEAHRTLEVGATFCLEVVLGSHVGERDGRSDGADGSEPPSDRPRSVLLDDILTGAGFGDVALDACLPAGAASQGSLRVSGRRARTLADTVGAGMGMLVCGLNPSEYAADARIGFARPGNRFWPAALAAGVVSRDRDPHHALVAHGIGMTDVVKRATPRSADLAAHEYRAGMDRIGRLLTWLRPSVVCFVGLEGYRIAVERTARAGWQPTPLARHTATYLMPSTSGLNARSSLDDLSRHLAAAAAGPPRRSR